LTETLQISKQKCDAFDWLQAPEPHVILHNPVLRFTEDLLEDDYYQFVYKIGLKTSADGNEYFDYELM